MDEEKTTEYGEFICSFDKWLPIEVQKERARKLAEITRKKSAKN